MRILLIAGIALGLAGPSLGADIASSALNARMTGAALEWAQHNGRLRQSMQAFPKGGDLHNHLSGAIYAESWLNWAAEDGLCVDMAGPAIKSRETNIQPSSAKIGAKIDVISDEKSCEASGWITAEAARANAGYRSQLIDSISNRNYVPTLDWSGHDDFFATFFRMTSASHRFGDKLAEVSERAGQQNTLYLELMETIVLGELFPLVGGLELTGDVGEDYQILMASPFAAKIPEFVKFIRSQIQSAQAKKTKLLGCDIDPSAVGCDVEIRFIHQVIREFDPALVYAQIILGWAVMDQVDEVVGLNLVAPEDGFIALRDYSYHMRMIDHLYKTLGERNITLHAGELAMGLVRPRQLRSHIREAIEIGHAKRIGHGVDIAYETGGEELAKKMAAENIMVEINLTSNDVILGISGQDHPIVMYRDLEVPYALSTDDEGVSRIDLTHEYMRFKTSYDVPYLELKHISRNSLTYSFLPGQSLWDSKACAASVAAEGEPNKDCKPILAISKKAQLQWELELRFRIYEKELRIPVRKVTSFK